MGVFKKDFSAERPRQIDVMSQKPKTETAPPPHLSKKMKDFWTGVFERKNLQPHQVLILIKACEAHDRAEQARRILKKEGLVYLDRFKQPRSRPEIAVERDSKALFAKLLSQVGLHDPFFNEGK